MNSRNKGVRGERDLAKTLQEYGYQTARGQQYSGANGDADVVGLPGIHIECKWVERLNLYAALEQAEDDAYADSIKHGYPMTPAVFHKRNGKPWTVSMRLTDWMRLYKAARRGDGE